MRRSSIRPARQDRSRHTEARLLQAAEEILEERGLKGASIPVIAKRAGVSAASIYRRFTDKDGLLREVFERFFDRAIKSNEAALNPEQWPCRSLASSVRTLVTGMVTAYRDRRGLLRAVITFGEQHPSSAVRRRAFELRQRSYAAVERIVLLHAKEIKHPKPEKAVHLGMQVIALALKERVLPACPNEPGSALSDEDLARELSQMFLGYLRSDSGR